MLSALHAGSQPITVAPGSLSRLRLHPRNITMKDDNSALVASIARSIRAAHSAGAQPCTLVVDASELGLHHLSPAFFQDMYNADVAQGLAKRVDAVIVENPNPLSKALYSVAKHLGSDICQKVQLK